MKTLKKTFICALILIPWVFLIAPIFTEQSEGFSLKTISAQLPFHPEWEGRELSAEEKQEIDHALSLPYHYLGSGGQCVTFASSDEKYVIKFFKQKKFTVPEWIEQFPIPFVLDWLKEKKTLKRQSKRDKVFSAFKLSFDHLADETGLLYVHLNQTDHLKTALTMTDAEGQTHTLKLDEFEFALQRKAELAYTVIDSLMANKQIGKAKQAIDELLKLNISLWKKGFRNRDANFRANCGFIGPNVILIDVGRVVCSNEKKSSEEYQKDLLEITPRLRKYLASKHPELVPYLRESIENISLELQ